MEAAAPQGLTAFDLAVVAIVGLSALLALARGAVREVLGLASWIGAIAVAFVAFPHVRPLVAPHLREPLIADAVALVLAFLVPFVGFRVLASLVARAVNAASLGTLDRLLGLAFGALRGALIVAAGYLVFSVFVPPERQPDTVREAVLLPHVREGAFGLAQWLPENARVLGEMVRPPDEPPPVPAPASAQPQQQPAAAAAPGGAGQGYTDAQRGGVDQLVPPRR